MVYRLVTSSYCIGQHLNGLRDSQQRYECVEHPMITLILRHFDLHSSQILLISYSRSRSFCNAWRAATYSLISTAKSILSLCAVEEVLVATSER